MRMRKSWLVFLALGFALLSGRSVADERPLVTWYVLDFPPVYILDGPLKGQGIGDKSIAYYNERIPEFRYRRVLVGLERALAAIAELDGACMGGLTKTEEREKKLLFSQSNLLVPASGLVVLKTMAHRYQPFLNESGEVRLELLLADTDLVPGVSSGRDYGDNINAFISARKGDIFATPNLEMATLMLRGRFDYSFAVGYEPGYHFRLARAPDGYLTFPVVGEVGLERAYVVCHDGPLGRQIIGRINEVAADPTARAALQYFLAEWLDDNARREFLAASGLPID